MKIYITKDQDGRMKAFYGKKPILNTETSNDAFWEIPLKDCNETNGFDIISRDGAYYYSDILLKLFEDIGEINYTDEPQEYIIKKSRVKKTITAYDIYIWLVDHRDKNHFKNGFNLKGYFFNLLVQIYGKIYFRTNKNKNNNAD